MYATFRLLTLFLICLSAQAAMATETTEIKKFNYPRIAPASPDFMVRTGQMTHFVYKTTNAGAFASFESDGDVMVTVEVEANIRDMKVLPLSLDIQPTIAGNIASFIIPTDKSVLVEIAGLEKLLISNYAIEKNKPNINDENVLYYKAGQVYEVGALRLESNQTLYIEGGAILRGNILAINAKNIAIKGHGVIDGGYYSPDEKLSSKFKEYGAAIKTVLLVGCDKVSLSKFTVIEPTSWCIVLYESKNVSLDRVTALSMGNGRDGLDIVGSKNVVAKGCTFFVGDDCVALKSFKLSDWMPQDVSDYDNSEKDWKGVENVTIEQCVLQPNIGGHAFEIGHELQKALGDVRNITFKDTDVVGAHDKSSIFGIHAYDGASIYNINYQNIRVDHYYNKLIDFRISKSRFSQDKKALLPERVSDILFKDIYITSSEFNPGYSLSVIGGYNKAHPIRNVTFDSFQINGERIIDIGDDRLALYTKYLENVKFK